MSRGADQVAPTGVHQPTLIVVAGPNGAGKTSLTEEILRHQWFEGCVYVNPDQIAQDRFGDWNSPDAVLKAARHAQAIREECLETRQSLAFETVFSTEDKLSFVRRAIANGFFVRFFFVGTDHPRINAARIATRVMEGGHDVPISKIVSRYNKSLHNLRWIIPDAQRAYVYDNSIDNTVAALQFRTANGLVEKVYQRGHQWADFVREQVIQIQPAKRKHDPWGHSR